MALGRWCVLLGVLLAGLGFSLTSRAECGGHVQCIGVGPTQRFAITQGQGHHPAPGMPNPTFTADFGNQAIGTSGASQTVYVAAVTAVSFTGNAANTGQAATLGPITIAGPDAAEFAITGGDCSTNPPLQDATLGTGRICTITVAFRPRTLGANNAPLAKSARLDIPLDPIPDCCISGRSVALVGTAVPATPSAGATTLSVPMDTPTTVDLAPLIGGTALQGIRIVTAPAHGAASVSGTSVTYTPGRLYLGADSFTYQSFSATASSAPATVTVSVVARADPSQDPRVSGLLNTQAQTARRFARAQLVNFQRRMESLHRAPGSEPEAGEGPGATAGPTAGPGSGLASGPARVSPPLSSQSSLAPLASLGSLASAGSLNLAYGSDRTGGSGAAGDGLSVWVGGTLQFGGRDPTSDSSGLRFGTDGISVGVDKRFSDRLALGIGAGYARDRTDIGTDGSKSRANGTSIAAYGSYQPTKNTFIDGVLGYGTLRFDTDRFVPAANDFARAHRTGDQLFASLAAGYEHRANGVLLSPYGRLDISSDRLKQASESGAGLNALTYLDQRLNTVQGSLGLRVESQHQTSFGWALPHLRAEYRHDFRKDGGATIAYADQFQFGGPLYSVSPVTAKRDALLLGIGSEFLLREGLRFGVDYQTQRLTGIDRSEVLRVWLAKDLDGQGMPSGLSSARMFAHPVNVEASYTWDSNVTRGRDERDRLSDHVYGLNVSQGAVVSLGTNSRLVASGFVGGDRFRNYQGLDRTSIGGQGELQYRASGEFSAPTLGLFGRLVFDDYRSNLRSGERQAVGVTYRQLLTDRIALFGALARNERSARNDVFSGRDWSARLNLDYTLGGVGGGGGGAGVGTIYLGGEYRRGDAVSSGFASAQSAAIAKVIGEEDAFGSDTRYAYRFEAETVLWTLGYNLPLGPRDGIDLSLRHVDSSPTTQGTFTLPAGPYGPGGAVTVGKLRYTVNIFSAAYLLRF